MDLSTQYIKTKKETSGKEEEKNLISKYEEDKQRYRKILAVSHGGFIMEFMNVIRSLKGSAPLYNNSAKNTSVYIIRFDIKEVKTKTGVNTKLAATVLLENDNSHLKPQTKKAERKMSDPFKEEKSKTKTTKIAKTSKKKSALDAFKKFSF